MRIMTSRDPNAWLAEPDTGEIFVEPTAEARFLLRTVPGFVSPRPETPRLVRAVRDSMVAPFPQLSFFSFDLQAYLFELLHGSWLARAGHFVGMGGAVTCLLALLSLVAGPTGVLLAAVLLAVWWSAVAERAGLTAWAFANVPVLAGVSWAALHLGAALSAPDLWGLWLGFGVLTAASHAGESLQPPRSFDDEAWGDLGAYLRPEGRGLVATRLLRAAWIFVAGVFSELWASQRLLPYNVLFLLFRLGYRADVRDRLHDRVQRALASGNPALDYVGIGGAAQLRIPDDA